MRIFEEFKLGELVLKNRVVKSATFEGMCDDRGCPTDRYVRMYEELAENGVGCLITGFTYVSDQGKAMHPGQGGLDRAEKVEAFRKVTGAVHKQGARILLQIAHAGRQTRKAETGFPVEGVSRKRSLYYLQKPRVLTTAEVFDIIDRFAEVSYFGKLAGFDGVQLHGAHGYLIHQFLLPGINNRSDLFKTDRNTGLGTKFLDLLIDKIRERCGEEYPVLIKISCTDNYFKPFTKEQYIELIRFLDRKRVAAIEVSCGTMDYSLNIFKGDIPVDVILARNPIYKTNNRMLRFLFKKIFLPVMNRKMKPFEPMYNLDYSKLAKSHTDTPILCVGGFRTGTEMEHALESNQTDLVSLCRPFLCEPDLLQKIANDINYRSMCTNCNVCTVMCDSGLPTRCYGRKA